ncbi:hypothetical protein BpHYR1_004247 [Brachionus plicatilis]|uniref:Uncharacterized protein n=1 Tax=Brachionus plicatilis TaxID=10195 RepID=A0A3M7RTN4_BRAPC|nr:hypothetical protein BpHYR1_004247 [Brachionus plicatilis]
MRSMILDGVEMMAIGRMSLGVAGFCTFGIGVMLPSRHSSMTIPLFTQWLKMSLLAKQYPRTARLVVRHNQDQVGEWLVACATCLHVPTCRLYSSYTSRVTLSLNDSQWLVKVLCVTNGLHESVDGAVRVCFNVSEKGIASSAKLKYWGELVGGPSGLRVSEMKKRFGLIGILLFISLFKSSPKFVKLLVTDRDVKYVTDN